MMEFKFLHWVRFWLNKKFKNRKFEFHQLRPIINSVLLISSWNLLIMQQQMLKIPLKNCLIIQLLTFCWFCLVCQLLMKCTYSIFCIFKILIVLLTTQSSRRCCNCPTLATINYISGLSVAYLISVKRLA